MELLFRDDPYLKACEARVVSAGPEGIRLDRTVFYPEGGGQPGDQGCLRLPDGSEIAIVNTVKGAGHEDVVHIPAEGATLPQPDSLVSAEIDWGRRHRLMRMHTCLHLLCGLIDGEVTGGQVGDGKGRLDFNLPDTSIDKVWLAGELNRLVGENHAVRARWISDAELAANPELVRTLSVKPPSGSGQVRLMEVEGVDLQPCGGTHVGHTGEIGPVEVGKIENKGRQNRRINIRFATA
jgi:misacylated tRNA(Ala) deacylase